MKPGYRIIILSVLAILACAAVCIFILMLVGIVAPRWIARPTLTPIRTTTLTPTQTATPVPTFTPTSTKIPVYGASGIGDPYFPQMGNGGYDVQHYDLNLHVDMDQQQISATALITARSTQNLDRFNLDLLGFTILSVKVNGLDAVFDHSEGELVVTPAIALPANSIFIIEVAYGGTPGEGETQAYLEGWNFYRGGVIVAGEPTGAETWFPVNNHPLDKATYTITVTVAEPYVVAANGVLHSEIQNGDGTRTFTWEMDDPMASYLATVDIGDFAILRDVTQSGVSIRSYLDPAIRAYAEEPVHQIPKILDYFESVFGPYPFDACGVVAHKYDLGFALEDQTLVVLGSNFDEITIVHELAHQWFGDSISLEKWQDIWLNEGFASYAERLWLEHTLGKKEADADTIRRFNGLDHWFGVPILIGDPGPDRLFDPAVYDRGALTLHALRLQVGDKAFFAILRTYLERFGGKNADTQDFISVAEEISGQSLTDLFTSWLYQYKLPGIPEMDLLPSDAD